MSRRNNFVTSKCLAGDFMCPDTVAPSHLNSTKRVAAAVVRQRNVRNTNLKKSYDLVPIATETLGSYFGVSIGGV